MPKKKAITSKRPFILLPWNKRKNLIQKLRKSITRSTWEVEEDIGSFQKMILGLGQCFISMAEAYRGGFKEGDPVEIDDKFFFSSLSMGLNLVSLAQLLDVSKLSMCLDSEAFRNFARLSLLEAPNPLKQMKILRKELEGKEISPN